MAQYDLLLTQNVAPSGVEFTERYVNIAKGGLLSGNASGVPTVLPVGANTYVLVADSAETTGLKWIAQSAGHTQNTDTGTTSATFTIDSDGTTGKIQIKADTATNNFQTVVQNGTLTADITLTLPTTTGTIALTSQLHTQNTDTGTTSNTFTIDSDGTTGKIILDADNVGANYTTTIANATQAASIVITLPSVTGTLPLDTGTNQLTWHIDMDGYALELTAVSASKLDLKVSGGATYADFQAKDATFATASVSAAPTLGDHLTNKTYVDGIIAAQDAMVFKGTVGAGGTYEIAAFNSLATYNCGWTFRIITAGTVKGKVCEIGDMIIAMVDRTGSGNLDSDWTVVQTNLDGAVIGPASTTDGYLVLFDGTTGKLIKAGTGAPGSMAYANTTDYVAKALFDANTILAANSDNTPAAVTVGTSTIVGRTAAGNIAALTPAEAMGVLWVTAPAAKNSTGTANQIAKDANWFYICTATDTWKRAPIATNW